MAASASAVSGIAICLISLFVWDSWVLFFFGFAAFIFWVARGLERSGNYQQTRDMELDVGYVQDVSVETSCTYEDAEVQYQRILIADRVDSDQGSSRFVAMDERFSVERGDPVVVAYANGVYLINVIKLGSPIIDER